MSEFFNGPAWKQFRFDMNEKQLWQYMEALKVPKQSEKWWEEREWIKNNCSDSVIAAEGAFYFRSSEDAILYKLWKE